MMSTPIERVQKLIALSASDQIEEARTAAKLACDLIRQHGIGLVAPGVIGVVDNANARREPAPPPYAPAENMADVFRRWAVDFNNMRPPPPPAPKPPPRRQPTPQDFTDFKTWSESRPGMEDYDLNFSGFSSAVADFIKDGFIKSVHNVNTGKEEGPPWAAAPPPVKHLFTCPHCGHAYAPSGSTSGDPCGSCRKKSNCLKCGKKHRRMEACR